MYSLIIPVYNRPDEVEELLESLTLQTYKDFEVIIVEDGSTIRCRTVCEKYAQRLKLSYYIKENSGPGQSRNYGAERAKGNYLIILDSDVVLPQNYMKAIDESLRKDPVDAFGGPDSAHPSFTPTQKAISYSMTAFLTTGGIRGGKKKLDKFYPRSFNMGIRAEVYKSLGGFSKMRFGEDIDFSIRIFKAGYQCKLFTKAWLWHKRRTDFRKFFRQVYNSGIARINLYKKYPESLKMVHLLPAAFTITCGVLLIMAISGLTILITRNSNTTDYTTIANTLITIGVVPLLIYALALMTEATYKNKSIKIGLLSVVAAFTQLIGYGLGFIQAWWKRCVRTEKEFHAFEKTFYK